MQPVLFSLIDVNTSRQLGASNVAQAGCQSPLNNNNKKPLVIQYKFIGDGMPAS